VVLRPVRGATVSLGGRYSTDYYDHTDAPTPGCLAFGPPWVLGRFHVPACLAHVRIPVGASHVCTPRTLQGNV